MSTDLFTVTVDERIDSKTVLLSIQSICTEFQYIPDDISFVLMLLHDSNREHNLFAQHVKFDTLLAPSWVREHGKGYVKHVELMREKKRPPRGLLKIEVTHAAWVAHLTEGLSWKTTAFDLDGVRECVECEPILPAPSGV